MSNAAKPKILFLCTGNSCRSQMAEGWTRALKGEELEAYSAGIAPQGLNGNAVKVMSEAGVDITGQQSIHVDAYAGMPFDYVVTVCDHAREHCPVLPGARNVVHVGFDDPPRLAREMDSEEAALAIYRRVRDEIREFVRGLPSNLRNQDTKQV